MLVDPWHFIAETSQNETLGLLKKWKKDHPGCAVLAMVTVGDMESVKVLQEDCRKVGIGLLGGVFPSVIVSSQVYGKGVLLFRMDSMPKYVLTGNVDVAKTVDDMADELLLSLRDENKHTLFMLFDAAISNISSLLDQCYLKVADTVSYVGGCAGSESFQPIPCLFDSNRFESNAMLAVLWPKKEEPFMRHGYMTPDNHITATSSSKNCIYSIEWRPAFDVYRELALSEYGMTITKENFYSVGAKFPFGIVRGCGEVLVRIPVALCDDGSLCCSGEIPENSMLTLLQSSEQDLMRGAVDFTQDLSASELSAGLIFYCAGRAMFLGEEKVRNELNVLSQAHGPVFGMMTLGEIGCTDDGSYPVLHNAAIAYCPKPG